MRRPAQVAGAVLGFVACSSFARAEGDAVVEGGGAKTPVSWEIDAGVSGIGETRFDGVSKHGDVRTIDSLLSAVATIETSGGPNIRLGVELERHDFGGVRAQRIPRDLASYALILGADFQLGDAWLARIEIAPGFYGSEGDVFRFGSMNAPIIVGASYFVSSDLQFALGISVNWNRKYPVLPGVGLRWRLNRSWVLDGILPQPRIEYSLSDSLTLHAGADFRGETYRTSDGFGRGRSPQLDDAVVDYSEIRVGGGVRWQINSHTTFQFEAGVVPIQELDYHRAGMRVFSAETPPYFDLSLKAKF
jgi:hypothetical protein